MPPATRAGSHLRRGHPYQYTSRERSPSSLNNATPSTARLRRFKAQPEATVNGSGDSEVFRPSDCIFVVHSGVDRSARPLDGHQYWKAQIVSIHSIRSKQWFLVRWFYTSSQLKEEGLTNSELDLLGNTELVLSNHEDVISADCIEARCGIKKFNDLDMTAEWLHPAEWYYRLEVELRGRRTALLKGINLTCKCQKMYAPSIDCQRYCSSCSKWFHVECMELSRPEIPRHKFKPASLQLSDTPIMRGWSGATRGMPWETVGTGRKLTALKGWLAKNTLPENWKQQLDESFVTAMTDKTWALYICPVCVAVI